MNRRPIGPRFTYVGIQVLGHFAMLLVNDEAHSTRCLVTYREDRPVKIRYVGSRLALLRKQIRRMEKAA